MSGAVVVGIGGTGGGSGKYGRGGGYTVGGCTS
jgi:hypothetical protein